MSVFGESQGIGLNIKPIEIVEAHIPETEKLIANVAAYLKDSCTIGEMTKKLVIEFCSGDTIELSIELV
jgi:hypothetical protein